MDESIQKIMSGDESAAASLIGRHELRIRLYAAKVAPRADMGEDIAQKSFLLALQNIDRFDPSRDFRLWVQGIVRNVARKEWERLAVRARLERDDLAEYIEKLADMPEKDEMEDRSAWLAALRSCIEKLPARSRETIKLRYGLDMKCKAVADRIGTTVDAAKMALMRIRGRLHDCIRARIAEGHGEL